MGNPHPEKDIRVLLKEKRLYPPPAAFVKSALVSGKAARERLQAAARRQPEKFWDRAARDLRWMKGWRKALDWKPPFAQWFVGGRLNLSDNCLDRHLEGPNRNKA